MKKDYSGSSAENTKNKNNANELSGSKGNSWGVALGEERNSGALDQNVNMEALVILVTHS